MYIEQLLSTAVVLKCSPYFRPQLLLAFNARCGYVMQTLWVIVNSGEENCALEKAGCGY